MLDLSFLEDKLLDFPSLLLVGIWFQIEIGLVMKIHKEPKVDSHKWGHYSIQEP